MPARPGRTARPRRLARRHRRIARRRPPLRARPAPPNCPPPTGKLCVTKFNDLNGNGFKAVAEPVLAGVTFTIAPAVPPVSQVTPATGQVCWTVPAGVYTVTEFGPATTNGWVPTTPVGRSVQVADRGGPRRPQRQPPLRRPQVPDRPLPVLFDQPNHAARVVRGADPQGPVRDANGQRHQAPGPVQPDAQDPRQHVGRDHEPERTPGLLPAVDAADAADDEQPGPGDEPVRQRHAAGPAPDRALPADREVGDDHLPGDPDRPRPLPLLLDPGPDAAHATARSSSSTSSARSRARSSARSRCAPRSGRPTRARRTG